MMTSAWDSFGITHPGTERPTNEDAFLERLDAGPGIGLWAVADGMGGHDAGEVASALIVDRLRKLPLTPSLAAMHEQASVTLAECNRALRALAGNERRIGSTAVVLMLLRERAAWLWVGDSRLYRLRQGKLMPLTRDHRYVEELVAQGLLDRAHADTHPWSHVLTRAVGAADQLDLEAGEDEVEAGDLFLLCSDGLTEAVGEAGLLAAVRSEPARRVAERLVDDALRHGASDNLTVVVVRVGSGDAPAMPG